MHRTRNTLLRGERTSQFVGIKWRRLLFVLDTGEARAVRWLRGLLNSGSEIGTFPESHYMFYVWGQDLTI